MNEVPLGFDWPDAGIRLERTKESIQIINKLEEKISESGINNN
jgi:hypothetical protein